MNSVLSIFFKGTSRDRSDLMNYCSCSLNYLEQVTPRDTASSLLPTGIQMAPNITFPKSGFDKDHPINLDSDEEEKATSPTGLKPVTCSPAQRTLSSMMIPVSLCSFVITLH